MTFLQKSILATITYFNLFDYPLTSTEVWKYLWHPGMNPGQDQKIPSLFEVITELEKLEKEGRIASGNGFYFLPGREALIKTRNLQHVIAYRKWRRALRIIRILRFFPHVRMIAVANTLAYDNADEESDIDLFIVAAKGRVWTTRFFVVLFLQFFGLRPKGDNRRDKICACFFVDETHLDISDLALPGEPDIYLHYWIATLWPVFSPELVEGQPSIYEKFFEANAWVRKNIPNIHAIIPNMFRSVRTSKWSKLSFDHLSALLPESFYRRLQERRFPDAIRTRLGKDTTVVANDHVLKFHTHDRREEYRRRFLEAVAVTIGE